VRGGAKGCLVPCIAVTGLQKRPGHSGSPDQFGWSTEGYVCRYSKHVMGNDKGEAEIGRSRRLRNVAMIITMKWWPIKAFETLVPQTAASHSCATETSFFSGSPPFSISPEWHRSRGRTLPKVRLPPAKSESMAKSRMMARDISLVRRGASLTYRVT
jgi:hypothetical protein